MNIRYSPSIIITTENEARLEALLHQRLLKDQRRYPQEVLDFLAGELDRATFIEPGKVRPNVVTMNSRVLFRDENGGINHEVTIVYPGSEDVDEDRISVVSPVGSALLGLREGQLITWRLASGPWRTLSVLKVTYQPEAHKQSER